jgi:hypothetical protein
LIKTIRIAALILLACLPALAQTDTNGFEGQINSILYANAIGKWTVPQGNAGQFTWTNPQTCTVSSGGVSFPAFTPNVPIRIVDANPALNEIVTVQTVRVTPQNCSITTSPVSHQHYSFYLASANAGLNESIVSAKQWLRVIALTPDWTAMGGTDTMIINAVGSTNVSIIDQRLNKCGIWIWDGAHYVSHPCEGAPSPVTIQNDGTLVGSEGTLDLLTSINNSWTTLDDVGNSRILITSNPRFTIDVNGNLIATQPALNLIAGTNTVISGADNPGAGRVDVTITAAPGSANAFYQHNNSLVAQQPALNFIDTPSVVGSVTNDPGNNRVNVSFNATTQVVPPPPLVIPIGQAVAWAYPTTCTQTGTLGLGSYQCGSSSGIVDRKVSCPLCDTNFGIQWGGFQMPTLPSDAVIQGIYGVMVSARTTTPVAIMSLSCNSVAFPVGGSTTNWSGEFATATLGTLSSVVTGGTCSVNSAANINLGTFGDDIVNTQLVAMAIYYTTATPPNQVAVPLFVQPFYSSIIGVAPTFNSVADGTPINWNLQNNFIQNGFVALNHSTATRALNVSAMQNGGVYNLEFRQDSTGGALVTLGSGCNWIIDNTGGSTSLPVPTTPNAISSLNFIYDGTNCLGTFSQTGGSVSYSSAPYSPTTTYAAGTIVRFNGCSWVAIVSNSGVQPGTDGGVDWGLLSCDGTNGTNGAAGTNGTNGAPGAPGYSPNQIISGGGVAWTGSGLNFVVSPTTYIINNSPTPYSCPLTTVNLPPADTTFDRIDAIVCNTAGIATSVTGTPSATPAPAAIDITAQIQLTFVYVAANATAPSNVTLTQMYVNNAEWTCAVSGGTVNCSSATTPHSPTLNIMYTAAAAGAWSQLTAPTGTYDLAQVTNQVIWMKFDAPMAPTRSLLLQWFNGATAKCSPITLKDGVLGLNTSNSLWQQVVVPASLYACQGIPVNRFRVTVQGSGTNPTFHMDDMSLQSGLAPPTASPSLIPCADWNTTTTFQVNCVSFDPSTGSTYRALQTNTNVPTSNAATWKIFETHGPAGINGNLQYKCSGTFCALNTTIDGSGNVVFPAKISALEFDATAATDQSLELVNSVSPSLSGAGNVKFISNAGVCQISSNTGAYINCATAFGGGTVTTLAVGNLAPLFTTVVTNPTTTPSVAYTLSNATAHRFLGNNTGSTAAPAYVAIGTADLPFTYSGNTTELGTVSGSTTNGHLAQWDASGNLIDGGAPSGGTVTNVTGTPPVVSSGGATPAISCPTCAIGPGTSTANHLAKFSGTDGVTLADGGAIPAGTVTAFTAGILSPIFTTSVATGTTTPALSFILTNAGAHTFLGNTSGSSAAPSYSAITVADLPAPSKTHTCEIVTGGLEASAPVLGTDSDTTDVCANLTGADVTITAVACKANVANSTITPILTGGGATSIVTGAITCGTTWTAGTINGTPTIHSFSANGATCSSTPCTVDSNITTIVGSPTYLVVHYTISQ